MKNIFYFITYAVLISISLGAVLVYKPFTYIDNSKSSIICTKNGSKYEIGPNFIYVLGNKIDKFNDIKARKLCEYGLVKDYSGSLKIPENVNYSLEIVKTKDSSWIDAILSGIVIFFLEIIFFETFYFVIKKRIGIIGKVFLNIFIKLIF